MRFYRLHLHGVDIEAYQTLTVGTYPDVAFAVACHTVDTVVGAGTDHTQLVTDGSVPGVGTLVVAHERALTVKPDIIHLVGKDFQRARFAQMLLGNVFVAPYGMFLVHDVAAYQSSIVIHNDGTILALADRTHCTLRYTLVVISIGEFIEQLLLHIVGNHTFVGNSGPEILVAIDIDDIGRALNTHARIDLFHVALKALRLGMIDTETCRCLNP